MDIKIASELLDNMPISRSNYEFKNFYVEKHSTFPRQLRTVLLEKEQLNDRLVELNGEIELLNLETEEELKISSRGSLVARINDAKINQLRRAVKDLEQQLLQVDKWLSSYTIEECKNAIDEFEQTESDYWTEELGKQSAVELLSINHIRHETMAMLNQLPLADYKKSVIITAQLATFLKETAFVAESTVFPQQSNAIPNGNNEQDQKEAV